MPGKPGNVATIAVMSSRLLLALLATAGAWLGLAGCGGGGGSSPSAFALVYATDWTSYDQPGGGLSQRVTLTDSNRMTVGQAVLNYGGAPIQQHLFGSVPRGTVLLRAELYSEPDLGGAKVGEAVRLIDLDRTTVVRSAVGRPANRLEVSPASATLFVPQNMAFVATAFAADHVAFLAPGTITWSASASIGSINATSGLFEAAQPGTGQVTATAGTLSDSSLVTVKPGQAGVAKWTVLVYMNAANDLNSFSVLNVNQMESAATNPQVRVVVQWKQATDVSPDQTFNGTRRYLIRHDTSPAVKSAVIQDLGTCVDMGDPATLSAFINWAKANYPAERYALVIWNHGNGWRRSAADLQRTRAFSYDDDTGNAIQAWQIGDALGGHGFDILAWDASLMQMLEVAYEAKDNAAYVVGSEESPPGEGYPYSAILGRFASNPSASSLNLAKAFVDAMVDNPPYAYRKISQSVIDTSKLGSLASAASSLSDALIANAGDLPAFVPNVRSNTKSYNPRGTPPRYYLDLYDLCVQIERNTGLTEVVVAASSVQAAVLEAVAYERHTALSDGSHGVSIDFSPSSSFAKDAADYARLRFAAETSWNECLLIAP